MKTVVEGVDSGLRQDSKDLVETYMQTPSLVFRHTESSGVPRHVPSAERDVWYFRTSEVLG